MKKMSLDDYRKLIKEKRQTSFKQPYDFVYETFQNLGYDKKDHEYFRINASQVVEDLRANCWATFKPIENEFHTKMLCELIDVDFVKDLGPVEAITWFADEYAEYFYALSLSHTQSRRSRAGKEFEAIIELILAGAGIPFDSQGNIGKQVFISKGLGKLVDVVTPGVVHYQLNKRNTVLISAKTSLRERWQEVPEEMGRTGASDMFLATLDETISEDVLNTLYEANIHITTTEKIKKKCYSNNQRVYSFEKLIITCLNALKEWDDYSFKNSEIGQIKDLTNKQMEKHKEHEFVRSHHEKLSKNLENK